MATTQEITDAIAAINLTLNRGLSEVTDQDGRSHKINLEELRLQRDRLQAQLNRSGRGPTRRHGIYNPAFLD